jgi:hypothetical protein
MAFFNFVGGGPSRSKVAERLGDIARRCGDLSPLREPVRRILIEGNRARALAGVDAQGRRFAPLAASTLSRRRGTGPPLAPRYAASRVVTAYVVNVIAGPGKLSFTGAWPSVHFMEYHHTGTRYMPRRDPYGFRQQDIDRIRPMLGDYILKRGFWR